MSQVCENSTLIFYPNDGTPLSTVVDWYLALTIAITLVIVVVCVAVFKKQKPYYDRLKVRHMVLVLLTVFGVLSQAIAGPLASISDAVFGDFPCWLRLFFMVMVPTGIGSSVLIKLMLFHFMSNLSRIAMRRHNDRSASEEDVTPQAIIRRRFQNTCVALRTGFMSLVRPLDEGSSETMLALKFLVSTSGQLTIAFLVSLPYLLLVLIVVLTIPEYKAGCSGCKTFPHVFTAFAIAALSLFSFCLILFFRIRNMPDFWGFGREIFYMFLAVIVAVVSFFLAFFVKEEFQVSQTIGLSFTVVAQTLYPVYIATKIEGKRKVRPQKNRKVDDKDKDNKHLAVSNAVGSSHANSTVASSSLHVDLKLMLQHPDLLKGFEDHLVKELAVESLLFYRDTVNWKTKYDSNTPAENMALGKKLYRTYIQPGCVLEINISSAMRSDIEKQISKNEALEKNVFDVANKEIAFLLQTGPLTRFAKTAEYLAIVEKAGLLAPIAGGEEDV